MRVDARWDLVGIGLAAFGLYFVAISGLMIAPGTFFTEVRSFGIRNDHYTIDAATFGLALGLGALIAIGAPAPRRVPATVARVVAGPAVTFWATKRPGAAGAKARRELGLSPLSAGARASAWGGHSQLHEPQPLR